jgi:hypothetical protein
MMINKSEVNALKKRTPEENQLVKSGQAGVNCLFGATDDKTTTQKKKGSYAKIEEKN